VISAPRAPFWRRTVLFQYTNHPSLVTVSLNGRCKDVRALESCPQLRRVCWASATVDEPTVADGLRGCVHFL
jgi:hypothetical protein